MFRTSAKALPTGRDEELIIETAQHPNVVVVEPVDEVVVVVVVANVVDVDVDVVEEVEEVEVDVVVDEVVEEVEVEVVVVVVVASDSK
jgi:hypothetical protein